ncbi:MAG: radical SAM protein [Polyangiaceae bacterium]
MQLPLDSGFESASAGTTGDASGRARRRWLELALDYRCNLRCIGCHACQDTGERLSGAEAGGYLRSARERGIDRLWLGGGEPTLRDDLLAIVRTARQMGFVEVALQTNGMRLAYPRYRDALLAAGVTEVRFNVKSHRADVHDRLSGGVPCHALAMEAIDRLAQLAGAPVRLVADVLLARGTAADLPLLVTDLARRGVKSIVLWLLSAADANDDAVRAEVPRIGDLWAALATARENAGRAGVELTSLHTPPCTLPPPLRGLFSPAADLGLLVVGPDARPFPLEDSPFEGGAYTKACWGCAARPSCGGPRADYVAIHGDSEFVSLEAPVAAGASS